TTKYFLYAVIYAFFAPLALLLLLLAPNVISFDPQMLGLTIVIIIIISVASLSAAASLIQKPGEE
ncbi:hypothetical protein KEJ51_07455, partial [Candidatus Bathyarchaeota archaeon]|nr:hypothetical protein [Candidatus Bathyarchaeota archaeon]